MNMTRMLQLSVLNIRAKYCHSSQYYIM